MIEITALQYRWLLIDQLRINTGITGVIGRNGSGKTTFLRLLSGILTPESGSILIDGKSPRETEVGWVNEYPDRNILFSRVYDEIASPLRFRHLPCRFIDKRVGFISGILKIEHLLERPVQEISGGEKVLVAIASALVHHPGLLLLDEYDSHLDALRSAEVDAVIRRSEIRYIIRCTQLMETAAVCDHLIYLDNSRIIYSGTPEEVMGQLRKTPFYPQSWRCKV